MTLLRSTIKIKGHLNEKEKGKYATSTENRRLVWEYIIWPLILEYNRSYFTPREYHKLRDKISIKGNIPISKMTGGIISLLVKGILVRDKNYYSVHYKLIPYLRKRVHLDYGTVLREISAKK
jgi:hypothetical protein